MPALDGKRVVIETRITIVFHLVCLIAEFTLIRILIEYVKNQATYIRALVECPES